MAVTFPDAVTFVGVSVNQVPANFSHTVTAGTTLLLVVLERLAPEEASAVSWNGAGMTLVTRLDVSDLSGDIGMSVWGLISPTPATGDVAITSSTSTWASQHWKAAVNVHGTVTTSVAAAISNLTIDENTSTTTTNVHASGGSSPNKLLFVGACAGNDSVPISNNASFTEILEDVTGGVDINHLDASAYIAHKDAPSAITVTWNADDENIGGLFELVAAAAAQDQSAIFKRIRGF